MILALDGFVPAGEYGHIERKTNAAGDVEWRAVYKEQTIALSDTERFSQLSRETYLLQGLEDKSARVITHAALHRHSHNSLLDATTKIKELVAKTEFCGALTDHGNMYGFLEYYQAMKEAKKKPIIGIEAYMVDMEGKLAGNHVILLAKNLQGYKNLLKLTSESFREENVKRQKPHVTWAMLEQYHEGIICMSACLSGLIPRLLAEQDYEKAKLVVERFLGIFGDDFYIEIQNHHFERETAVRPQLVALARECGVKIVATSDSHYAMPEDREAHQAVRCLARGKTLYDDSMKWYDGDGYWLLSSEEMEERFAEYPEALDNSLEIADKCNLEIPLGAVNLPNYKIPAPYTSPDEYMEHIAREGFQSRFQGTEHLSDPVYLERFQYEIDMIKQMGFPSYFVIVWDFINFARQNNIYVGPGRGSAAGSLIAYCMGITDVDPIHYNLLFERFLNPERVSYPDIDTDIEHRGRPLVMQHMRQLYGENNVCRIITFGAFAAKRAILDMAKVLGCSSSFGVSLAKYIPAMPGVTIEDALEQSYELSSAYKTDPMAKRVIDLALKIEGNKRHASVHACGVAVAPGPVSDYLPTAYMTEEKTGERCLVSQVPMTDVEPLSLIKMDLLGLENLDVIHMTIDRVVKNIGKDAMLQLLHSQGPDIRYQDIPLGDRATYEMLRAGNTGGVFQFESSGIKQVLQDMLYDLPQMTDEELAAGKAFERMVVTNALYRPGPMDCIPQYLQGMRDPDKVVYDSPEEEPILNSTYGVMVYQEQLMHIAQALAGYTLGRADIIRKGAAKKKRSILDKEHPVFVAGNHAEYEAGKDKNYAPGCIQNGIPRQVAEQIWAKMEKFGQYAFNRSHSVCYAWVGYLTAWLKCHFPKEFYASMLTEFLSDTDKKKVYLSQVNRMGIKILPPNVQTSPLNFSDCEDGIEFGLYGISGLKSQAVAIVQERERGGPFKDAQDFYFRLADAGAKLDKTSVEGLVYSGALSCFSSNKAALLNYFKILKKEYTNSGNMIEGQMTLLTGDLAVIPMPQIKPMSRAEEMQKEREAVSIYLSQHPTDIYAPKLRKRYDYIPLEDIVQMTAAKKQVKTMGLVMALKHFYTKGTNNEMAVFTLETRFRELPCVIFPKQFEKLSDQVKEGQVLCFQGDLVEDRKKEDAYQFAVSEVYLPEAELQKELRGVMIKVNNKVEQDAVLNYIRQHPGDGAVILSACGTEFPQRIKVDDSDESFAELQKLFDCKILA